MNPYEPKTLDLMREKFQELVGEAQSLKQLENKLNAGRKLSLRVKQTARQLKRIRRDLKNG